MHKEWYKDWFASEEYLKVYSHRNQNDAKKLINLIFNNITIPKNSIILDAACGMGRHSILLSRLGHTVFGFDLSRSFLKIAVESNSDSNTNANFFCADIRHVLFKKSFALILNLFTSFGYFESDIENFRFIRNSNLFMRENGYFILDYMNKNFLTNNLIQKTRKEYDDFDVIEEREIKGDRVIKNIIINREGKKKIFLESVKLYSVNKIEDEFRKSEYKLVRLFGDYDGNDFSNTNSQRVIFIFQKC
jgi:SAM-dependent methyltransferase